MLPRTAQFPREVDDDGEPVLRVTASSSELSATVVDSIRTVDRAQWNDVVERAVAGTIFHRYEWLEAIERGLGYPARHVLVEKDTNLIGLFPNFVVSLPKTPFSRLTSIYPGFGGPLATTDVADALSLAHDALARLDDSATVLHEVRACNPNVLRYGDFFRSRGYQCNRVEGRFLLNLARGYDEVFEEMDSSKRRAIRRGRETDHEIVESELTLDAIARFHQRYARRMRNIDGIVYPRSFFEHLAAMDEHVLLVTLRVEGEYAGGFLELLDEQRSTVHGFFAGVPAEYFEYHSSELLYDYVFQWAIENGYETYDFGGAGSDFQDGFFQFKEEFGGDLVPNLYWERGTNPVWPAVKAGRSLYRKHTD
ncbi:GNAT family N-acetyltransferase [Halobacteria archaeon AArc-dxtr1]|nr:GNAT family N-acetyltransferase [Halobacteria archaeon AArc-dxtr1]